MKIGLSILLSFLCVFGTISVKAQEVISDEQLAIYGNLAIFGTPELALTAADAIKERGDQDMIATLILAGRYSNNWSAIQPALETLTNTKLQNWEDAMLWQEAHPEIVPHLSYRNSKLDLFKRIDPNFMQFFVDETSNRENMKIRLEEITWGGVKVDGIPSLDDPKLILANEADYLIDDDLVFGVSINGDTRAYPLRIMGWHEMFNETIGGVPVALAYCTLCGSGILFETDVENQTEKFVFGSSGFLYRSNKLMFDRQTNSLWNQFTGEPVSGPLVNSGIKLKIRPVTITTWKRWKARHADTKVLSLKTGHRRDYSSGAVYNAYFSSPDLMFPAIVKDETAIVRKDYVYGIREFGAAKAWPLKAFETKTVINDHIGTQNIVLIGNPANREVRAYKRDGFVFEPATDETLLGSDGDWRITEDALIGPNGKKLDRVSGHIAYWFAWENYLGADSDLFDLSANTSK